MPSEQCNNRMRGADGPWHRCVCKIAYVATDWKGRKYNICRFHAKDMRHDPRIFKMERV